VAATFGASQMAFAYGLAKSVHVTVVDGHGEENELMDNSVLMEIESLRRATLAALREKYREVFQEETTVRHREHLFRRIAWRLQALAEGDLSERASASDCAGCGIANGRAARLLYCGRRACPNDSRGPESPGAGCLKDLFVGDHLANLYHACPECSPELLCGTLRPLGSRKNDKRTNVNFRFRSRCSIIGKTGITAAVPGR
jgi:hypothetical protein